MRVPFSFLLVVIPVAGATWSARADDPAGTVPFAPGSKWKTVDEGGTVTLAGRQGGSILLQGTGSGISGENGKAVLLHQYFGAQTLTARLVSLSGAGGNGEAGIRLENHDHPSFGENIGVRLFFRADGTLRWEGEIYTYGVVPGPPVTGLSLPLWLRVQWASGTLGGSYSKDGVIWTNVTGALPITLPPVAQPGLLVSSQGNAAPAQATFDNVWIAGGDADDNGILDGWEMEHFGRLLGASASEDPDADGSSNLEEWMWHLDPKNQDMKPSLECQALPDGRLRLQLPDYDIFWEQVTFESALKLEGPWTTVEGVSSLGIPPYWLTATVTPAGSAQFFRARKVAPYSSNDPAPPFIYP